MRWFLGLVLWSATVVPLAAADAPASVSAKKGTELTWQNAKVTLYSNGMASFGREASLKAGETATVVLPIRHEHAADILASLAVSGDLEISEPASLYLGAAPASRLELNSKSVIEGLASSLSGSEIVIRKSAGDPIKGTLVGLDVTTSGTSERKHMIVRGESGISRVSLDEIADFQFPDAAVQGEISKALAQNFRKIRPDATTVKLTVKAKSDTKIGLQYTVPAAAWRMSYRLRELDNGTFEIEGHAIVDNTTAEDWARHTVAVVTGSPVTFSTDLAQAKVPARQHINLVPGVAQGNVGTERADAGDFGSAPRPQGRVLEGAFGAPPAAPESARMSAASVSAVTPLTRLAEVGDFTIFTSKAPINIASGHAADIPVFKAVLPKSEAVLLYKHAENAERAFRAVQFKNDSGHALGKGAATVYLKNGVYGGNCVVNPAKKGEESVLVHALESGIKVARQVGQLERRYVSIAFSKGVLVSQASHSVSTTYRVRNLGAAKLKLLVDHAKLLSGSEVSFRIGDGETKRLATDARPEVALDAESEAVVTVDERKVEQEQILVGQNPAVIAPWVRANIIDARGPLAGDEGLLKCVELQAEIDKLQASLAEEKETVQTLETRQESIRKNLLASGADSPNRGEWNNKLAENQKRIEASQEKTQPELATKLKAAQKALRDAALELTASWSEPKK